MKRGDIVQLGRHRLMCGDCTSKEEVSRLLDRSKASTVIFSPPYKKRRKYAGGPCLEGTSLFVGALESMSAADDVQVFVVVGNLHSNGEQDLFYEPWLAEARRLGWRRFSQYVWDKQHGLPGNFAGRLAPCFEWIFHLNKQSRQPAKCVKTLWGEGQHFRKHTFAKSNVFLAKNKDFLVSDFKIPDNIIRLNPSGRCAGIGHPAIFPVELPKQLLRFYAYPGSIVYDPMSGSGSTMIAAEILGLPSVMCEISPEYCNIAIDRYHKYIETVNAPSKPKRKVLTSSDHSSSKPEQMLF